MEEKLVTKKNTKIFRKRFFFLIRKSSWKKKKDKKETKLTLKKSREKEDPSMKKTAWFCQIARVKGKTFSKEKSRTWEEDFL